MTDDALLTDSAKVGTVVRHLVAMVEVKASLCKINGPWSDRGDAAGEISRTNMARALARVGFGNRREIEAAASAMYDSLRYEGKDFVVQYFAVGGNTSPELASRYEKLRQITFDQIANFLRERFKCFPEKIPQDRSISLWPGFGDSFRWWFESNGYRLHPPRNSAKVPFAGTLKPGCVERDSDLLPRVSLSLRRSCRGRPCKSGKFINRP